MSTPPSSSPLSLVRGGGRLLGSWNVLDAAGVLPGAVRLRLERDTDGATLEVVVSPRGGQRMSWTQGILCNVIETCHVISLTAGTPISCDDNYISTGDSFNA